MTKAVFLFSAILLLVTQILSAQVAISTDGSDPDPSAMLDVRSTDKGFLPPRMTDEERDAIPNPASGLIIFNTSVLTWQGWNSVSWINFDGSSCVPAAPGAISGNTVFLPNAAGEVYSISAVPNATSYDWTLPSDAVITAGQGTTSITVTFGIEVGNVSVRSLSGCGNSIFTDLAVSCVPPAPVFLSGNTEVDCYATGEVYTISAVPGATYYEWTVPSDATIVSGQGTTSITVDFGVLDEISVRVLNLCGYSDYTIIGVYTGLHVGSYYAGGVVFYLDPADPCNHGLVCAITDQDGGSGIQWYNGSNVFTGASGSAIGTGQANTTAIINTQGAGSYAASVCDNYTTGSYSDWFLPSRDEINQMYQNRAAIDATAIANGGSGFTNSAYWSSTEHFTNYQAWALYWSSGSMAYTYKSYSRSVRAVRAF